MLPWTRAPRLALTVLPAAQHPEGVKVEPEAGLQFNEEETWDEEEETLVEVRVQVSQSGLYVELLRRAVDPREFEEPASCFWSAACQNGSD